MNTHRTQQAVNRQRRRGALALASYVLALMFAWFGSTTGSTGQPRPVFVIIAHPKVSTSTVTQDFLAQVFFKRTTRWTDGEAIRPVDLALKSQVRSAFSSSILKRSTPAVRGYWLQRIFSGRQVPPPELESDEAVIRYVLATPGAVGYVSSAVDPAPAKVLTLR